jgi:hypothetical protein
VNGLRELAGFESDSAESQRPFGVLGLGRSFAARENHARAWQCRSGLSISNENDEAVLFSERSGPPAQVRKLVSQKQDDARRASGAQR